MIFSKFSSATAAQAKVARPLGNTLRVNVLTLLSILAIFLTSACTDSGPNPQLTYEAPKKKTRSSVELGAGTMDSAFAIVSKRLSDAGLNIVSRNAETGLIQARSNSEKFVNCGKISQKIGKAPATFKADSAVSVLILDEYPAGLLIREVSVKNSFAIQIVAGESNFANIQQSHDIQVQMLTADRSKVVWRESNTVNGDKAAKFSDNTKCISTGAIHTIVRGG